MAEVRAFLKVCAAIEHESAELYHWLSRLFSDSQRVSLLWKKTALEEENHESQFLLAEKLADDLVAIPLQSQEEAQARLERIRELRREFEMRPPGLIPALRAAILLEDELAGFHMEKALLYSDERHQQMFDAMMAHDRGHSEALRGLLSELMVDGDQGA